MATTKNKAKSKWIRLGLLLAPLAIIYYFFDTIKGYLMPVISKVQKPSTVTIYGADYRGKTTNRSIAVGEQGNYVNNRVVQGYKWFNTPLERSNWIARVNKQLNR